MIGDRDNWNMENRHSRYRDLCQRVKNDYKMREECEKKQKGLRLLGCSECEEINLWTYWQGRGNMYPKILLVGQDWWNLEDSYAQAIIKNVRAINSGATYNCNKGMNPACKTDENLIELFASLECGYDDLFHKSYKDLFFTNICLGYRSEGASGGLKTKYIDMDIKYFKELVEILEPRVIICLGKETFRGVRKAFHITCDLDQGSYNQFITKSNPHKITLENGKSIYIFAMAHCGAIGTINRNRGTLIGEDKLILQKKDWRLIRQYLE